MTQIIIESVTSVLGTTKKPNPLWYVKEATKNNFSCRSKETGNIFFIYTNRGNLKLNPEFVGMFPERRYQVLFSYFEERFPELKIRFTFLPPKIMLMNSSDMSKVNYSKN
jgi:hypothetical protein